MHTARYSDTTHGRFIAHMDLARAWARWNGQRGTERQISRIMGRLSAETLERMLAERLDWRVCRDCGRAIETGSCRCPDED
jgi:hypothetical protein